MKDVLRLEKKAHGRRGRKKKRDISIEKRSLMLFTFGNVYGWNYYLLDVECRSTPHFATVDYSHHSNRASWGALVLQSGAASVTAAPCPRCFWTRSTQLPNLGTKHHNTLQKKLLNATSTTTILLKKKQNCFKIYQVYTGHNLLEVTQFNPLDAPKRLGAT